MARVKRLILALAVLMLVPASAQAATVSPEKQAIMDRNGWSATDEDSETAYPLGAGPTGDCAHGRSRRAASALRNRHHNAMVRGGLKLALCAGNGHITAHGVEVRHASPGHGWQPDGIGKEVHSNWIGGCSCRFHAHARFWWHYNSHSYITEFSVWRLDIDVEGHVKRGTDHQLKFDVSRRWQ